MPALRGSRAAPVAALPHDKVIADLLATVPGVGRVTVATLLALLPELGRLYGKAGVVAAGAAETFLVSRAAVPPLPGCTSIGLSRSTSCASASSC